MSNFKEVILNLQAIQETFKNHRIIVLSFQDIPGLVKLQKSYFETSGNPGDLKIIQKCFGVSKTFQDLSKFKKVILNLQAILETFKNHTKRFWSVQDIPGLVKLQKSYFEPSGNP